jgi:acetyl esterase/lipase
MLLLLQELEHSCIPLPEVLEVSHDYKSPHRSCPKLIRTQFSANNPAPPVDWNDVIAFRAGMESAVTVINASLPAAYDILESEVAVPMRDGCHAIARVRKPKVPSANGCPLIVLAFGGGWIAGDNKQMAVEARSFVRAFSAVVVNISYRLAPEYKFPQGWEDTWDNLVWLVAHASELGADHTKGLIIGGTSAGAALTAVCARKAQIEPLASPLTGQWLNVPSILGEHHIPEKWKHLYLSMRQNKDAPILPSSALDSLQKHTGWDMSSPWRSPLSSTQSLAGLPKTYIQVDGMDCLRDDGLLYDEMLREAGVETRCDLYAGCPHAHATFVPGRAAEKAQLDLVKNVGWMFGREVNEVTAREALGLL